MSRPPETTSSEASAFASSTAVWCGGTRMPVPSRRRVVNPAMRARDVTLSRKGVSAGVGTGLSRTGSTTCSPVHTDSQPDSSAAVTTWRWTSGSAHDPKLTPKSPKRIGRSPHVDALEASEQARQLGGELAARQHALAAERLGRLHDVDLRVADEAERLDVGRGGVAREELEGAHGVGVAEIDDDEPCTVRRGRQRVGAACALRRDAEVVGGFVDSRVEEQVTHEIDRVGHPGRLSVRRRGDQPISAVRSTPDARRANTALMRRRRHPSLIPLSHHHRDALALAFRLHHPAPPGPVTAMTPASTPQSRAADTLAFFARDLVAHFRAEEDVLFPFLRARQHRMELLDLLVAEHRELEALRDRLAGATDDVALAPVLTAFADLLEAHVRREERELFEHFPEAIAPDDAHALAAGIRSAIGRPAPPA